MASACRTLKGGGALIALLSVLIVANQSRHAPVHRRRTRETKSDPPSDKTYRPNILLVVMDDLGYADLGYHGYSGIETPADELVAQGLQLKNFYAHSTCTITRAALLTGRYPYRMGMYSVLAALSNYGVPLEEETIADVLKDGGAGYQTHAVGKWHLGHARWEYTPTFRGFKSFFGFLVGGAQDHYTHTEDGAYDMWKMTRENCGEGCAEYYQATGIYSSALYAQQTAEIVKAHNPDDGPLFIYLPFQAVHSPRQFPGKFKKEYRDKPWDRRKKEFAAYLSAADDALGQVIAAYKDAGLWQDTLVIYQTDNGAPNGEIRTYTSNYPSRGGKKDIWEGGVLGEGFLSGPAMAKLDIPTGVHEPIIHTVDWLPTLASITGSHRTGSLPLDGIDQWSVLQGGIPKKKTFFLGYSATDKHGGKYGPDDNYCAIRQDNWKLIRDPDKTTFYLYDLSEDPGEENDLSSRNTEVVMLLKAEMLQYEQSFAQALKKDETCFKRSFGETPWGQTAWRPWCEINFRKTPRTRKPRPIRAPRTPKPSRAR